jgi:hypothetical protein
MPLKDSIQVVINKILDERDLTGESPTADLVKERALAAIIVGQGNPGAAQITPEWRLYMELFADEPINPIHLARLLPTDGTHNNAAMQKERAYLLGNGVCGATTTDTTLDGGVTDELGQTIQ